MCWPITGAQFQVVPQRLPSFDVLLLWDTSMLTNANHWLATGGAGLQMPPGNTTPTANPIRLGPEWAVHK
jgi:hypothetical protein